MTTPIGIEEFDDADRELGVDVLFFAKRQNDDNDPTGDYDGPPDLDPYFELVAGTYAVAQAVALRCGWTRKGTLRDAPTVGIDLRDFLAMAMTPTGLAQVKSLVQVEVEGDERVRSSTVTITADNAANTMAVDIDGTTAAGPFALTLNIADVTTAIFHTT